MTFQNYSLKRVISALLVFCTLLSFFYMTTPVSVYAKETSKTETEITGEIVVKKDDETITKDEWPAEAEGIEQVAFKAIEKVKIVPKYNQLDYSCPYGEYGTVASHGCGVTCLSMVATYLLDDLSLTPDVLAERFGEYNTAKGSYWILFEDSAKALKLGEVKRVYGWSKEIEDSLRNGQLVVSLQKTGLFTGGGHFILLTGINEDGKVMVNDPNGNNWLKTYELKTKFKNGFNFSDIYDNGTVYWIYPKKTPKIIVKGIPKYNQNYCFANSSGSSLSNDTYLSSITALSMITTYLKNDPSATPVALAELFKEYNLGANSVYGDSLDLFANCSEILEIDEIKQVYNWDDGKIEEALKNGQPVISCQFGGPWGNKSHIVVLVGLNDNGKIIVYDPHENCVNNESLNSGLMNGFEPSEIAKNSFACWVFPEKN